MTGIPEPTPRYRALYLCGCSVETEEPPAFCPWHPGVTWSIKTEAGEFDAPGMVWPVAKWVAR